VAKRSFELFVLRPFIIVFVILSEIITVVTDVLQVPSHGLNTFDN